MPRSPASSRPASVIALVGAQWSRDLATDHLGVLHALALGALLWELAAPLLLVRSRCRRGYATTAIVFHVSVLLVVCVDIIGMAVACLAMFRLERVGERLVATGRRLATRSSRRPPGIVVIPQGSVARIQVT
ncbi:MAG: hypothetical protein L0H84_18590 [Pseudonocardia sp.]|nr:hypothetical protein [Pseudonocardia sp.]